MEKLGPEIGKIVRFWIMKILSGYGKSLIVQTGK